MSIGVRHLTVLGEFNPFGLTAESSDGKPSQEGVEEGHYNYFLFDPEITRDKDDDHLFATDRRSLASGCSDDYELFIRGNRIIWSMGSQVHKRFSCPSTVLTACWCRMASTSDALLCVLHTDTLSIYNASGEAVCIPLLYSIAHIWPLPFGLLLQKSLDKNRPISSSSLLLNARDLSRPNKEYGGSHYISNQPHSFESNMKEDGATMSSHLILKHPLEEPQATYFEERGKLSIMKDFDERTIWTSDVIPLMVSYHKGKMQHSVWFIEIGINSESVNASSVSHAIRDEIHRQQFSLRKIWQGKCSQSAASKVFLSTDNDGVPIICFLLQDQKAILAMRLQIDEGNDDSLVDIRPDLSWSIPAIAAAPVIVTHPRVKVGPLPFTDIILLSSENYLLLYTGKQCLCKYLLPVGLGKKLSTHNDQSRERANISYDLKIIGVDNSVKGRINVTANNGQVFRCALRRHPSSSLASDCIASMAEGLHHSLYNHFAILLWGDHETAYLSNTDSHVDSEWESFTATLMKICKQYASTPSTASTLPETAWEFLINSKFHNKYRQQASFRGLSLVREIKSSGSDYTDAYVQDVRHGEVSFYAQLLMETLDSLHAVYENLKLDNVRKRDLRHLVLLLCNIAASLGEANYVDYYIRDFPCVSHEVHSFHSAINPKFPPCLFRWLENCLRLGCDLVNIDDLPHLIRKEKSYAVSWARKIVCFYSLLLGAEQIGRKLSSGVYYSLAKGSAKTSEELTVLAMVAERFGRQQLNLLPVGVSLPLHHALDKCRESPPTDWPAAAYVLVGREDLAMSCLGSCKMERHSQDSVNLISISVPHMLHFQPVTIPPSYSDVARSDSVKSDEAEPPEDGMDHIFTSSTQLRYGCDLRLNEVRRLLCSARPVAIQTSVNPSASDQDLQQHQLWNIAQRTTALPFGRGAFTLATTYSLLTEALVIPKLVLAGRLPAQQNATVNLDPNIRSISELRSWPEFHNGVAAGLRLAPFQGKMSRTWILYNKPVEPNFIHAGILLALGLHEHLRVLTITDVYRYLSQEHDITTVGVLLGMAASHRGTMQPAISKMLYLHIPSRHPSSFPELELPTILQSAALMAVGLLYEGSAHPLTMNILLGEIGRRSGGDNVLEREGYSVAAGCALGLVALGQGGDAFGSIDNFVDRLFHYTGSKQVYNERSLRVGREDQNRNIGQMMDGTQINVDVTAPGATIALALIFLKTESDTIASRLHIPVTHFDLQYVRPDFIMLRVIARNLIMWNRVCPSREWVEFQIPEIVKVGILKAGDMTDGSDDFDAEALVQAYVNIVAGACISLGLKYAGTKNGDAQELLYNYATYFLNEIKHTSSPATNDLPKGLSQYVDRGTLEMCLHLIVLSLSVVMAGSGHLQTFRLLRYLRGRSSAEGHLNYGIQMAVSLAIGFLFLGGGMKTFSTENSAIAVLLITLYPRLPTGPNDNRCHLQAFRHLYVIAAESRWVQTVDVDTGLPVYVPLELTIKETDHYAETSFCEVTPCILPERSVLKNVQVCGPRYWPQVIRLVPEDKPWWNPGDKNDPFNGGLLYIKRKVGSCSYVDDPIGCQSLLSRAMHKIFDTSSLRNSATRLGNGIEPVSLKVEQLVSTFSADPSLIAFSQLCCDSPWNSRSDSTFQEFCSQVLFECVSKDRPALLQVYLSLYTMIGSMWELVNSGHSDFSDSCFISSLKLALAYNDALMCGKLTCAKGGIIQSTFLESLRKHIEEILMHSQRLKVNLLNYLNLWEWPNDPHNEKVDAMLLSWYLQLYDVPSPHVVKSAIERVKAIVPTASSVLPLLRLLLPTTHCRAITVIDDSMHVSSRD